MYVCVCVWSVLAHVPMYVFGLYYVLFALHSHTMHTRIHSQITYSCTQGTQAHTHAHNAHTHNKGGFTVTLVGHCEHCILSLMLLTLCDAGINFSSIPALTSESDQSDFECHVANYSSYYLNSFFTQR